MRICCIGFGGPPAHILLLRRLCVEKRGGREFDDGIATMNLLPGPASTQPAIFCAWRLRGRAGALIGRICFIVPRLILILALFALFLERNAPTWALAMAAGAGAAVPAVALNAAWTRAPSSRNGMTARLIERVRWVCYVVVVVGVTAALLGSYLVRALVTCGVTEIMVRGLGVPGPSGTTRTMSAAAIGHVGAVGGLGAPAPVALKVGALSHGGGFVIVHLMQRDVVSTYRWMSSTQFLSAVAPRAGHARTRGADRRRRRLRSSRHRRRTTCGAQSV